MAKRYILTFGLVALLIPLIAFPAWGIVPQLLHFQGRLTDAGGIPLEGDYTIRFYLYSDPDEIGEFLWSEEQTLTLLGGVFNAQLGVVALFPANFFNDNVELYLEIWIFNEAASPSRWEILSPRQQITSAAFSFKSENSDKLNGLGSDSFSLNDHAHAWSEISDIPADLADGDDGIITETDPTVPAEIKDGIDWSEVGNIPADLADGDQVGLLAETDPTVPAEIKDGIDWSEIGNIPAGFADGTDDGSGVVSEEVVYGIVPKWGGEALVPGDIFNDFFGNVGIGTTTPQNKLDVIGDVYVQGSIAISPSRRYCSLGPFDFNTRHPDDGILRSSNHLEGNAGVGINSPISITFSKAMDFSNIDTFRVRENQPHSATTPVAGGANVGDGTISEVDTSSNTLTESWTVTCSQAGPDPSSATTPVAGGANVGDGTISEVTTSSNTLTESWTVTCSEVTLFQTKFSVTGTSSGNHLDALEGVQYHSNASEVSFLITEGSTPFAVGDSFTFNTTAEGLGTPFSVTGTSSGNHLDALEGVQYHSNASEVSFLITEGSTPFAVGDSFTFNTTAEGNRIEGIVTHGEKTAIFTPDSSLNYATSYNAQIGPIQDFEGNDISHVWSFTTKSAPAPDGKAPTVIATSPSNLSNMVELFAPLHLPNGAKIRKLSVYAGNYHYENTMGVIIFRTPGGYNVNSQTDPFASPAEDVLVVNIPPNSGDTTVVEEWADEEGKGVIDNANYSYSVFAVWFDSPDYDEYLYRVLIEYDITNPLP